MAGQNTLEAHSMVVIIEAFASFAVVAGVLLAVSDTRFYPLAFGVVGVAVMYTILGHPAILSSLGNLLQTAGSVASGSSKPSSSGVGVAPFKG